MISPRRRHFALAAPLATGCNRPTALKLSLVTETYPPEINGVAMTLSHLVEGLAHRGHRVTLHRPRQGKLDTPRTDGLYIEDLTPGVPIPGYSFLRAGLPARGRLLRQWRTARPDLVHIATEGPLGWSALSAADALGLPLSSSFHTNFHAYSRHYGAAFATRPVLAYLRWFHNRTRLTLSPTAELNAELTRDGFANMRLMARGVNTRIFTPAGRDPALRATWGAAPADLVVVHVSRLAAEKNYPLLFAAFDRIKAALPSAHLVIVSDGPSRKKLRRQRPDAVFTGFLPRADLARHYASADLFLYPSLTETFGNVLTESMASGLPVLAFNYAAAARYVTHDVNGLVAPFDDSVTFLDHAIALATDPARRARLGAAARLTAEAISWDAVLDALECDLHQVAGLPPPTATRPSAP